MCVCVYCLKVIGLSIIIINNKNKNSDLIQFVFNKIITEEHAMAIILITVHPNLPPLNIEHTLINHSYGLYNYNDGALPQRLCKTISLN